MSLVPDQATFRQLAQQSDLIPVCLDLMADLETPVSVYARLRALGSPFLFESVTGGDKLGRYSFCGAAPALTLTAWEDRTEIVRRDGTKETLPTPADPLSLVKKELSGLRVAKVPGLPPFVGGMVGMVGYEYVHRIEPTVPKPAKDPAGTPLLHFMLVDRVGQRRVGDGDYGSSENFVPYIGDNWSRPWESCQKFDGGWFWRGKDSSQSLNWAMRNLFDTVSRGGNFLMNMGPTPEGLLPPVSVKKLKPLGQWLAANGECVYGSERGPHYLLDWGTSTRRGNTLYYQVFDWPKDGALIIPGLNEDKPNAGIQKITFLNHEAPVSFQQVGQDVHVQLPIKPADPILTVLKVELECEPVVNNAIRALGKPLRPQTGNSKVSTGDYFLSAAFAKIHGDSLHFSLGSGAGAQRENLKGWMNPSDWAEWTLLVEEPGSYNVKVNYYSWMESGRFAVEVAGDSFEHAVQAGELKGKASPLKAGPLSVTLGQLRFDEPGAYSLSVKALEITPEAIEYGQGLIGLKDVILESVK